MADLNLPGQRTMLSPAPVWKRVLAFFADLIIIQFIILGPFAGSFSNVLPSSTDFMQDYNYISTNTELINQLTLMVVIVFVLIFAYFFLFEYNLKQSPGKMIFKLYVVPVSKKDTLSILKLIGRNVAVFPFFPFSLLWIIDPLYLLITGRRLSDVLTRTLVVEEINI